MTGVGVTVLSLGLAFASVATVHAAPAGELKPGDMAPAFTLPGTDGKMHSLAEYRGKQAVVLAWFVKAFTGG